MQVIDWNGRDLPEQLKNLPAGRYVLGAVGEAPPLPQVAFDAVPMPANVRVTPPPDTLDPKLRALSGAWEGLWGGVRASRLVVETVGEADAVVAYGIVASRRETGARPASSGRWSATIDADGVLTFGRDRVWLSFTLANDGSTLAGVHATDGVVGGRVTMTRSGPPVLSA